MHIGSTLCQREDDELEYHCCTTLLCSCKCATSACGGTHTHTDTHTCMHTRLRAACCPFKCRSGEQQHCYHPTPPQPTTPLHTPPYHERTHGRNQRLCRVCALTQLYGTKRQGPYTALWHIRTGEATMRPALICVAPHGSACPLTQVAGVSNGSEQAHMLCMLLPTVRHRSSTAPGWSTARCCSRPFAAAAGNTCAGGGTSFGSLGVTATISLSRLRSSMLCFSGPQIPVLNQGDMLTQPCYHSK